MANLTSATTANASKSISFDEVYKSNYSNIYSYILSQTKNQLTSEELVNEVFIKVFRFMESNFEGGEIEAKRWLTTITKNTLIDHFRAVKRLKLTYISDYVDDSGNEFFELPSDSQTDSEIEGENISLAVQKAMKNLSAKNQKIAELYFIDQMKYKEIAEILELPMNSIKALINRIRQQLTKELQPLVS